MVARTCLALLGRRRRLAERLLWPGVVQSDPCDSPASAHGCPRLGTVRGAPPVRAGRHRL